jgi:molecular chaperone DnaK
VRSTIDYGIDLGTTNSAVAVNSGSGIEVIRTNEGNHETTPSAVFIDKGGQLVVGRTAYEKLESDPENSVSEFKLGMGAAREHVFARSGRRLSPPQLSAEVLKSLKADARERLNEEVEAAVITVPAAFEFPQCEATQQAARLAGLSVSPLLQEPVAAALAYGYKSDREKVFWLVYDFGGGTFDAAVIQLRDNSIQVVNHAGDNHLGGKLIDWAIVEDILVPALARERRMADFRRGNPKWRGAFAKLKAAAEQAKIRLSRQASAEVSIDFLCNDERGEPVSFEYQLKRPELETLTEPLILRSINLCRNVLSERRLGSSDIEKVILVGGPTLTPFLRSQVGDALGIPLDFSQDPMTVVARGASIFAGTQRFEAAGPKATRGQYSVTLDYKPVGADIEPLVGGAVKAADGSPTTGLTIELVNTTSQPTWRSGKLGLAPNGAFVANLFAERGRKNVYSIELNDATGRRLEVVPDEFAYTVGLDLSDPPLLKSMGVALASNEVVWFFEKGVSLPARARKNLKTIVEVRRGQANQAIRIPVLEGDNRRADRNQQIGALEIPATKLKRDVPAGSEVEFTIQVDASRLIRINAYLPILDEEFEVVVSFDDYRKNAGNSDALRRDLDRELKRLEEARQKVDETGDDRATQGLRVIDGERMVHDVEAALGASQGDPDAADKCQKRLLDLRIAIDKVEESLEWPALVADAEKEIEMERGVINDAQYQATSEEKATFARLEREIRAAITARDVELLRMKKSQMDELGFAIILRHPGFWVARLQYLEGRKHELTNQGQADALIAQARRAIANNDLESLKAAVRQLGSLLHVGEADRDAIWSTVTK